MWSRSIQRRLPYVYKYTFTSDVGKIQQEGWGRVTNTVRFLREKGKVKFVYVGMSVLHSDESLLM